MEKCDECGITEDVITTKQIWSGWGHNAFDFNWNKYEGQVSLCPECEGEGYVFCRSCDAAINAYYYGTGYLPDWYDDETLCPECAEKEGFECKVYIGPPPCGHSGNYHLGIGG